MGHGAERSDEVTTDEPARQPPPPPSADDSTMATEWPAPFLPTGATPGPDTAILARPNREVSWYIPLIGRALMVCAALVVVATLAYGAYHAFEFTASQPVTQPPIAVSGVPTLDVRNAGGSVRVVTGRADQIEVRATVRARGFSRAAARRQLEQTHITPRVSEGTGGTVVTLDARQGSGWPIFGGGSSEVTITVPQRSNLILTMSAGSIEVRDVTGAFTIAANAGNTELAGVTFAGASRIESHVGNVTIDGALAENADLEIRGTAGNINVTLPGRTATRLDASATPGEITIDPWSVPVVEQGARVRATGNLGANPNSTLTIRATAAHILVAASSARRGPAAPPAPAGPESPAR